MLLHCPDAENGLLNSDQIRFIKPVILDGKQFMLAAFCAGEPKPIPIYYGAAEDMDDAIEACGEITKGTFALSTFSGLVDSVRHRHACRETIAKEREERERQVAAERERLANKVARDRKWFLAAVLVIAPLYLLALAYNQFHPKPAYTPGIGFEWPQDLSTRLRYGWYYLQVGLVYAFINAVISASVKAKESATSTAFNMLLWPVSLLASTINGIAGLIGDGLAALSRSRQSY